MQSKQSYVLIGALTSKPYAFKGRSWELTSVGSIDIFDALGSNIRVDTRGTEILRITANLNNVINEEWISDKIRFFFDGLKYQRILVPLVKWVGVHFPIDWATGANLFKMWYLNGLKYFDCMVGDLVDFKSVDVFKTFVSSVGFSNIVYNGRYSTIDSNLRLNYMFNVPVDQLKFCDFFLFLGFNPRYEVPVLNLKFRSLFLHQSKRFFSFGYFRDLGYKVFNLGNNTGDLFKYLEGRSKYSLSFFKARKPVVFLGTSLVQRRDSSVFSNMLSLLLTKFGFMRGRVSLKWLGFNYVVSGVSELHLLDLGCVSKTGLFNTKHRSAMVGDASLFRERGLLIYGADNFSVERTFFWYNYYSKVIYFGHHASTHTYFSDLVFPLHAPMEKQGVYLNFNGVLQRSFKVVEGPQIDMPVLDSDVFFELFKSLNVFVNSGLRNKMLDLDVVEKSGLVSFFEKQVLDFFGKKEVFYSVANVGSLFHMENFHMTEPLSKASVVLSIASKSYQKGNNMNFSII